MNDQTTATGVERMREAARLMRERAEKATPGPWFATGQATRYGGFVAARTDEYPEDEGYGGHLIGESMSVANREHIAPWSRETVLAVADLLDSLADYYDYHGLEPMPKPLAIADAYLREAVTS